jgi:esterase/lipase
MALLYVFFFCLVSGCASGALKTDSLHTSSLYYNYLQPSFAEYIDVSRQWLSENRTFISDDKVRELSMNSPFMLSPQRKSDKAVLLVHGLGDSPYTFIDMAQALKKQGFHVQVLLLPGHGSKPDDMMLTRYADWQRIVDHYAALLKAEYKIVWLGGFSTGANLVTVNAIEKKGIAGLLLFSPAFKNKLSFFEQFSPLIASITDWTWQASETNLVKYSSSTSRGFVAYTKSAAAARASLARKIVELPTLIVVSESDSVVDATAVVDFFKTRFDNPRSKLLWYGERVINEPRVQTASMQLPNFRISSASHMGVLFAPENDYYGLDGEKRLCDYRLNKAETQQCEHGDNTWYSAWGYEEAGRLYSRLTWNPYFDELLSVLSVLTLEDTL